MTRRRFVLFLIVGLLTFLIGVTAAIALGGFDPLERFSRHGRRHLTIPPQPLIAPDKAPSCNKDGRLRYAQPRTADLRYHNKSLTPPPPRIEPGTSFDEESETSKPSTPSARR